MAFQHVIDFKEKYGIDVNNLLVEAIEWSYMRKSLSFGNYMKLWRLVFSRQFQPRLFSDDLYEMECPLKEKPITSQRHRKEGFQLRFKL